MERWADAILEVGSPRSVVSNNLSAPYIIDSTENQRFLFLELTPERQIRTLEWKPSGGVTFSVGT